MEECFRCKVDKESKKLSEHGSTMLTDSGCEIMYITSSRLTGEPLFRLIKGDFKNIVDGFTFTDDGDVIKCTDVKYIPRFLDEDKLVVIAEKEELKLVEKLGYNNLPFLITGPGAINVMNALKNTPRDTQIINIGYAGSKNLEPGKFYSVDRVALYHPNVNYPEQSYNLSTIGYVKDDMIQAKACYTSSDFVLNSDIDDCLFDMELAYICALGFDNVISYKYVSDNLDLQEYREKLNEK